MRGPEAAPAIKAALEFLALKSVRYMLVLLPYILGQFFL